MAYATAYLILKSQRFTVALTSVERHETMPAVLKRLLREAAKAGVRPHIPAWASGRSDQHREGVGGWYEC